MWVMCHKVLHLERFRGEKMRMNMFYITMYMVKKKGGGGVHI